jgi:hypothetical protein
MGKPPVLVMFVRENKTGETPGGPPVGEEIGAAWNFRKGVKAKKSGRV